MSTKEPVERTFTFTEQEVRVLAQAVHQSRERATIYGYNPPLGLASALKKLERPA